MYYDCVLSTIFLPPVVIHYRREENNGSHLLSWPILYMNLVSIETSIKQHVCFSFPFSKHLFSDSKYQNDVLDLGKSNLKIINVKVCLRLVQGLSSNNYSKRKLDSKRLKLMVFLLVSSSKNINPFGGERITENKIRLHIVQYNAMVLYLF